LTSSGEDKNAFQGKALSPAILIATFKPSALG